MSLIVELLLSTNIWDHRCKFFTKKLKKLLQRKSEWIVYYNVWCLRNCLLVSLRSEIFYQILNLNLFLLQLM